MPFLFRSTTSFFYTDIYTTPSFSFSFTRNLALEFHDIESFVDIMWICLYVYILVPQIQEFVYL